MRRFLAICALLAACATSSDEQIDDFPFDPSEEPREISSEWITEVRIPGHLKRLSAEDEAFVANAVHALSARDFRTYSAAASGLVELGEPVTPYLGHIGELRSPSERIFRVVTVVMGPVLSQLEPERLSLYLHSPYRTARATAARVTGDRDLMEHARTLVSLLDDTDLFVRRAAIVALRKLTNRFHGYNPETTAARRSAPVRRWRELLGSG